MPGDVSIGDHTAEVLDHDGCPFHASPPECAEPRPGIVPEPRPAQPKQADADDRPDGHDRRGTPRREPDERPDTQDRQQEPGVDLGQECEGPDGSGAGHRDQRPPRSNRPFPGQEGQGPEQAQERVQGREMGVGEDAGHRQQGEAGGHARGSSPPPASFVDDQAHQGGERQRRGQPARQHIVASRVRPLPEHLERLAQDRGDSQQPTAQRRMFGVVSKDPIDHGGVEEMPTSGSQDFEIGPAGPHIERFVDRQPGSIQRQDHRQTRADPHRHRERPDRINARLATLSTEARTEISSPKGFPAGGWSLGHSGSLAQLILWRFLRPSPCLKISEEVAHAVAAAVDCD